MTVADAELPGGEPASADEPLSRLSPQSEQLRLNEESSENIWIDAVAKDANHTGMNRVDVPAFLRPGHQVPPHLADDDDKVWDEARHQQNHGGKLIKVPETNPSGDKFLQTNPFLKRKPVPRSQGDSALDSSSGKLNIEESDHIRNPWQAAISTSTALESGQASSQASKDLLELGSDPWERQEAPAPPSQQPIVAGSTVAMSLPSEDKLNWDDDAHSANGKCLGQIPPTAAMSDELMEDQHVWDDLGSLNSGKGKALDIPTTQKAQLDDLNLMDKGHSSNKTGTGGNPPLPPRTDGGRPRWIPSRGRIDGETETYQVKIIRWYDAGYAHNPRSSPILVQNKNGPCPLVALVNALTLTTPADIADTALVQSLQPRERVSLNFILDAVFDELMSPRRTRPEDALPDVTDLYAFLQSLHTGMNVNPRFIPTLEFEKAYKNMSLSHLDTVDRERLIPGTFENTMEMKLYATFSIPLIHGWLPSRQDAAFEPLWRRAHSYEESQNLMFREEELESKLLNAQCGLSETEEKLYQDILTIKLFLNESATQLTPWGIEVITKAMRPGTFAILFRNDHFSTLYCHPQTKQLLSLVTDAGYGRHEKVVWESLVDVNGERTEYLSGDFQSVGASGRTDSSAGVEAPRDQRGAEVAVQNNHEKERQPEQEVTQDPLNEQVDRDLALALQLQEEEEQRHHEEQAERRHESLLSEQYIEQQGHRPIPVSRGHARGQSNGCVISERHGSSSVHMSVADDAAAGMSEPVQQVRPLIPSHRSRVTRREDDGTEDAPPPYEQASQGPAFLPPAGQPSHSESSPLASRQTPRANLATNGQGPTRPMQLMNSTGRRRRPVSPEAAFPSGGGGGQGRDRECVAM